MTGYIVLQKIVLQAGIEEAWRICYPPTESNSGEAAIRKAIKDRNNGGVFVAVPIRSWSPLEVVIETKRTVAIGEPGEVVAAEPEPEAAVLSEEEQDGISREAEILAEAGASGIELESEFTDRELDGDGDAAAAMASHVPETRGEVPPGGAY